MQCDRPGDCPGLGTAHLQPMAEAARERRGLCGAALLAVSMVLLLAGSVTAASPDPPDKVPVPQPNPETPTSENSTTPASPPLPEPRPETVTPRPGPKGHAPIIPPEPPPSPPRPARSAEEDRQCLDDLKKLGVEFSKQEPLSDPAGCAVANPVLLKSLGKTIGLAPDALLDCPMALATARFIQDVAAAQAKRDLGSDLTSVNHASAYVCRPRNGTTKLSEHAFGNALDIASFGLADGRRIEVKPDATGAEKTFLEAIRKAACGPFKTVLGPGSDADHALHFHFDLAPRRSGSTFCQ
jgi:hypothetical protein